MFWNERMETLGIRTDGKLIEPGTLPRFEGKAKRVVDKRGVLF
jgi:phenylacetate-CoA ligase